MSRAKLILASVEEPLIDTIDRDLEKFREEVLAIHQELRDRMLEAFRNTTPDVRSYVARSLREEAEFYAANGANEILSICNATRITGQIQQRSAGHRKPARRSET